MTYRNTNSKADS